MVTLNDEPIDHLPYIDEVVTPEERTHVDQLVRNELEVQNGQGIDVLHPSVAQILPLNDNNEGNLARPLLIQEIERYEQEQEEDEDIDDNNGGIIQNGIDMSRYSEFSSPSISGLEHIHYDNLYATLSYASLQKRNLSLLSQNEEQLRQLHEAHINGLIDIEQQYNEDLHKKRHSIEDINVLRKRRQVVDFKPVNDYLNDRWKGGIKSVVELGIEAQRMDMDIH